jgi:hypothetical protein
MPSSLYSTNNIPSSPTPTGLMPSTDDDNQSFYSARMSNSPRHSVSHESSQLLGNNIAGSPVPSIHSNQTNHLSTFANQSKQ